MIEDHDRFAAAIERFDAVNAEDPRTEIDQGEKWPKELLYARRMTQWLARVEPNASEHLQLAARCQHICRWEIPRGTYSMDQKGYHQWRGRLYEFHANTAGAILRSVGYDEGTVERVRELLMKMRLKADPEMQTLEDVACLVFLANDFSDFSKQHDEDKMIRILQKTWRKMSPRGREVALQLGLSKADRALIARASNAS